MDTNKIGEAAERYVVETLLSNGYELCKYGHDVRRTGNNLETTFNLPVMDVCALQIPIGRNPIKLSQKNAYEVLDSFSKNQLSVQGFSLVNFFVNEFIQRYYWKHNADCKAAGNPPHHGTTYIQFLSSKNKEKREFAEKCKQENLDWYAHNQPEFPGSGSHPGKYDFVGYFDGDYVALEVKANTSKLSFWQSVRLGLLKRFGCKVKLIRVTVDKCGNVTDCVADSCKELLIPLDVTDELFRSVINFRALHEKSETGSANFIKKYKSIKC